MLQSPPLWPTLHQYLSLIWKIPQSYDPLEFRGPLTLELKLLSDFTRHTQLGNDALEKPALDMALANSHFEKTLASELLTKTIAKIVIATRSFIFI